MADLSLARLLSDVAEREHRIKEAVGPVARLPEDVISAAYGDGVLVQLHVSWWRGFKVMTPADLGMEPTEAAQVFLNKAVTLGGKRLLPKEVTGRLKTLEVMGRDSLKRHSFRTLFGDFVPCTAYSAWKEKYARYRDEFYELVNEVVDKYDEVVAAVRESWVEGAPELYRMARGGEPPPGYAEETAGRVVSQIRSPGELLNSFSYEQELRLVPIPSETQVDMLKTEQAKRVNRLGAERAKLVEEFNRDIAREFEGRKAKVIDFVGGIQQEIAGKLIEICDGVSGTLNGKVSIPNQTADKLRRLIGEARALNFVDDAVTNKRLDAIEAELDRKEVGVEKLQSTLRAVGAQAQEDIESMRKVRSAGAFVLEIDS